MATFDPRDFPRAARAGESAVPWLVLKFGGTSVSTAANWRTIAGLLRERLAAGYRPFVVHSALAGVSNGIVRALEASVRGEHAEILRGIATAHRDLVIELEIAEPPAVAARLAELEQVLSGCALLREVSPRSHARAMAIGELLATAIGAAFLESVGTRVTWMDAREMLRSSDGNGASERSGYLNAACDFEIDESLQARCAAVDGVILTQGFIASNARGETVILGRGGSDTSASYFAARLAATGVEIWTDVPGMFSANPRAVQGARVLRVLSYAEAQEVASTGGSVLHPRCIAPVRRHGIPLRVKDTTQPALAGTLVTKDPGSDSPRVKAISGRSSITLVSMETPGMWHQVGFLADAFRCFSDLGLSVDLVSTSESNVTLTLDPGANSMDAGLLDQLQTSLGRLCRVQILENVEVVSLVGQKIRAILHELAHAFEVFEDSPVHLLTQAASDLNLSIVVGEGQSRRIMQSLHELLVKPLAEDAVFGPTWEELRANVERRAAPPEPWWVRRREELVGIARARSAAYVYDLDTVRAAIGRLRSIPAISRILYAMKANNFAPILAEVVRAGLGLDCVSPAEIEHVLALHPTIDRRRILFTPNFAPRDEYAWALEQGVWLTLDNIYPLRHWGELFRDREIFLRIDTGQGRGHHSHVRTACVHSKFGIPLWELEETAQLVADHGARIVGLHAHAGSGILRPDNWQDVAGVLADVTRRFPQVRILDLGGGIGIPEKRDQAPVDLEAVAAGLEQFRRLWPQFELWIEPGRYLVAESGVLVATVTQTKGKGDLRYVGVATGMNSLIRPALYGAYHEIVNISRWGEPADTVTTVVGPICESGDRLGTDRWLTRCEEGDVLAIANAGAYGATMSSRYNLRAPADELAI